MPEKLINPEITETLKVGDLVKHPFREEKVPILFIGEKIDKFIAKAYAESYRKTNRGPVCEAIEGSDEHRNLLTSGIFEIVNTRNELSAEIDFSNDIEKRTIVVPLNKLSKN